MNATHTPFRRIAIFAGIALAPFFSPLACSSESSSTTGSDADASNSSESDSATADASTTADGSTPTSGCALAANTTATAVASPSGCAVVTRDASACEAARTAAGISGFWLKFSCRVTLTKSGNVVSAASDGQPDHLSNYFAASNECHETYTAATQNPNTIAALSLSMQMSATPDTTSTKMGGGIVGMAVNGVPIFGNFAGPGDDIYTEAATFDRCAGHPQQAGQYHYHSEPFSLSYDDGNLIGVMRDGYPVYGRKDADGTTPALDGNGGHTTVTGDSPTTAVYHYHLNEQTSTTQGTIGQKQWFLTTGNYKGTPGSCTGCM